jgi:copper resistance protein B
MSGCTRVLRCAAFAAALLAWSADAGGQTTAAPAPSSVQGHAGHARPQEKPASPEPPQHQQPPHEAPDGHAASTPEATPAADLPPITDEDRKAAFPELTEQHTVHDDGIHYFVLFDQLEWQAGEGPNGLSWDNKGWIGGDVNRFWFRTEGEGADGDLEDAQAHALYGRAIAPWWDLVVGVRQDVRPGPAQTWAAVGIQGLAPYWFEVEATAYVGESGRTHFRFETEYELLLTNRLVLQPLAEIEIYGKSDPVHGIGAGLGELDAGLRLRYEFRREFAPYVGVTWNRKFFGTADLAEAAGEDTSGTRLAVGVRMWF